MWGEEERGGGGSHILYSPLTPSWNLGTLLPHFQERKTEKKGKGSKKKKDPNAPKKPLTAYMVWLGENRPALKAKYPGLSITELSKKAGELWKTLDDKSVSKLSTNLQWLIAFMFTCSNT